MPGGLPEAAIFSVQAEDVEAHLGVLRHLKAAGVPVHDECVAQRSEGRVFTSVLDEVVVEREEAFKATVKAVIDEFGDRVRVLVVPIFESVDGGSRSVSVSRENDVVCAACRKKQENASTMLVCPACRVVKYCSTACQSCAWTEGGHREECVQLQQIGSCPCGSGKVALYCYHPLEGPYGVPGGE
jgi:hypothetical protein